MNFRFKDLEDLIVSIFKILGYLTCCSNSVSISNAWINSSSVFIFRLMDVKQGQNKEGKTVLYLVFEYMDTDLKKYIRSFRQTGENIPVNCVKVWPNPGLNLNFFQTHLSQSHHWYLQCRAWCTNSARVLPSATGMVCCTGKFHSL